MDSDWRHSLIQDSHSESFSEWILQKDWTKDNALQIDFGNIVKASVQLSTQNQGSGLIIWVKEWVNFIERLVQRQCSVNWLWQHRKSICSAFNTKPCQNYIMVQNSTLLHWCCGTRFTLEQAQYCLESHSLIESWSNPVGALWLPCIVELVHKKPVPLMLPAIINRTKK